jgi:hypothetical protein
MADAITITRRAFPSAGRATVLRLTIDIRIGSSGNGAPIPSSMAGRAISSVTIGPITEGGVVIGIGVVMLVITILQSVRGCSNRLVIMPVCIDLPPGSRCGTLAANG